MIFQNPVANVLYVSISMRHDIWEKQNYRDRKQICGSQRLRADHKRISKIWGLHTELFCTLIRVLIT